jgi:antitoxin VapB
MPLGIKGPEADRLARALAQRTGETLTEAVIKALRELARRCATKEATGAGRDRPPCHHHHPAVHAREAQPRCGSRLAAPIAHDL